MKKGVLNQSTVTKNMCWRKMNIQMNERNKKEGKNRIIQIVSTNCYSVNIHSVGVCVY